MTKQLNTTTSSLFLLPCFFSCQEKLKHLNPSAGIQATESSLFTCSREVGVGRRRQPVPMMSCKVPSPPSKLVTTLYKWSEKGYQGLLCSFNAHTSWVLTPLISLPLSLRRVGSSVPRVNEPLTTPNAPGPGAGQEELLSGHLQSKPQASHRAVS